MDVVQKLFDRGSGHTAELYIFLVMPPPMAFGDIVGHGYGCPPHLWTQGVTFLWRQLLDEFVCVLPELSGQTI
jgi:hypothetical protein